MMWIWIGLIITFTLIELLTTNLITIWYVASSIIALILSLFVDNYIIQFSAFAIIGTILLFTARDYLLVLLNEKKKQTLVNKTGTVVEEIRKNKQGKVKVNGKKYIAISNKKIKVGHIIKIIDIYGNKVNVVEDKNEK